MVQYFITGGTGTVGSSLISSLLQENNDDTFVIATRKIPKVNDNKRIQYLYCDFATDHYKTVITDDIIQKTDIVLHMAADVRWEISLEESAKTNLGPTKSLAELFQKNKNLKKFVFISTSASCPPKRMEGLSYIVEQDGYKFANCYEYTKYRCENFLREQANLPWMIVRFPLVKGDSKTGHISKFIGSYLIYRFLVKGKVPAYVSSQDAYSDVVPIDSVIETITKAIQTTDTQKTYMITANNGEDRIKDFIDMSTDLINDYCVKNNYETYKTLPLISPADYFSGMRDFYLNLLSDFGKREYIKFESFIPYASYASPIPRDNVDEVISAPSHDVFLKACVPYWCESQKRRLKKMETAPCNITM